MPVRILESALMELPAGEDPPAAQPSASEPNPATMRPSDNPPSIIVRPARGSDIHALAELIEPFIEEKVLLRRTIDELALLLPEFFVAESNGRLVGCAALEIYSSKLAEIRSLVVRPEMQGQGIGKMLVEACLDLARQEQILEVMAITAAENFFRSCGFDFTLPGQKKALFFKTRDE